MTWAGYYLGSLIPDIDKYLLPIVLVIIVISVIPPIWHLYKENKKTWHEKVREKIYEFFKYKI
jgi:membrane-associated protein